MNLRILLQSRKNNLILIGEPGVGKTGIVEGFAQLLSEGNLPEALGKPAVIGISLTSLVGTKGSGARGRRLAKMRKRRAKRLFFDSLWPLAPDPQPLNRCGSMDAANILKPALARGAVRVIGATTIREYRQSIEKDGARVGRDRRARPLVRQVEKKKRGGGTPPLKIGH